MHQSRMIAAAREHLRHDLFFANVGLVEVLDLNTRLSAYFLGACPNALAQRLGEARIVKNADAARIQKARHPLRVTRPRQRVNFFVMPP